MPRSRLALALLALALLPAPGARAEPAPWPRVEASGDRPLFMGAHPRIQGFDGAFSLPLGDGTSLWLFGDTLIGPKRGVLEDFLPNAAAIVKGEEARFLGKPDPVFAWPDRPAGRRFWPLDLVEAPGGARFAFYVGIEGTGGTGPFDFAIKEIGVARVGKAAPFRDAGTLFDGDAPLYGSSVLVEGGTAYLYAGGAPTRLARVEASALTERPAYRFFSAGKWVEDAKAASALPDSGAELSVRWNPYLERFVMLYAPPLEKRIMMRLAPKPEGPWSEAREVYAPPCAAEPVALVYGAKQHAELDAEGGRTIVLTYNTNAAPPEALDTRPELYWPRRLTLRFTR